MKIHRDSHHDRGMILEMISSDRSRATATRRERNRRVSFLWISIRLFRSTNFLELRLRTRCFYGSNIGTFVERRPQQVRLQLSSSFNLLLFCFRLYEFFAKDLQSHRCVEHAIFFPFEDEDDRSIVARKTIAVTYTELVFRWSFWHSSSRTFHTRAFQSDPSCYVESVFFYREVLGALLESLNYRDADITSTSSKTYRYFLIILDSRSAFPSYRPIFFGIVTFSLSTLSFDSHARLILLSLLIFIGYTLVLRIPDAKHRFR